MLIRACAADEYLGCFLKLSSGECINVDISAASNAPIRVIVIFIFYRNCPCGQKMSYTFYLIGEPTVRKFMGLIIAKVWESINLRESENGGDISCTCWRPT